MLSFHLKSSICTYVFINFTIFICLYFMKRSMCNLHFTVNSVQSFSPLASRHRLFLIPVLHSLVCTSGPTSSQCLPTPPPSFSQSIPIDRPLQTIICYCNLLHQSIPFNPIQRHQSIDRYRAILTDRSNRSSQSN